jgi:hypothetical protein
MTAMRRQFMQMIVEEHSEESLKIFSQGAEQMMIAVLRSAAEGESILV